jgi:hypothetical protein
MLALCALAMLGFAAYCGSRLYDGFRIGEMQLLTRGSAPFFFKRFEPILFWAAAAFNGFMTFVFATGGVVLLVQEASRR